MMNIKKMDISKKYLNIPVKNGAPKVLMNFSIKRKTVREFWVEMALGEPDYWVFSEVDQFKGSQLELSVKNGAEDLELERIIQSDEIMNSDDLYKEKYRPQVHFSSRRGWINDPNGLVYYDGEYHLFYQHNPYGTGWSNMHWGHAVSSDLLRWKELEIALYPDEMGTMYSGSGIVDYKNTSCLKEGENDTIILAYTAAGDRSEQSKGKPFVQCLAYSSDKGRTWEKFKGNPIIDFIVDGNRDPKIIWHSPTNKWVMALYLDKFDYALFTSDNLKEWAKECEFEVTGCSECPDIFELPVDGDLGHKKWVFWGGNGSYLIGDFDGKRFVPESEVWKSNIGNVSYAGQTWSDVPEEDGRRIQITWARFDLPDMPFNRFMTFPCELTLRETEEGIRLCTNPIREISDLYRKKHEFYDIKVKECNAALADVEGELFDFKMEFEPAKDSALDLNIRGLRLTYCAQKQELQCGKERAQLKPIDGKINLRMLIDRTSIEIYGNHGLVFFPVGFLPDESSQYIRISEENDDTIIKTLEINELNGIWD